MSQPLESTIRNIVFDLGNVIINIDVPRAAHAFAGLAGKPPAEVLRLFEESGLFGQFETGRLSAPAFRDYVRRLLGHPEWEDEAIDEAWNALLLDIPPARIRAIQRLRPNYRLFLLSNTSSIHVQKVNRILHEATGVERLDDLFEQLFLSYEMGVMKPDAEIYLKVLDEAGLAAAETLFLDDNADNIRGARAVGIQTFHVQPPLTMLDYLRAYVA